ncbi:WD40 repeat-like protein [Dendrothele bispora CBS 962.96]|uniref:WD40 repeat-like protein n=1 Tax=Dendrothele bispora (strain CBS 962.96) TaxID=1314807 RepID=A0A4S8MXD9_DENBC|nr:WD40 repeat-like protein [Dendrothele bispora CBS 962.96]
MAQTNTSNLLVSESYLVLSDARNQKAEKLKNVGEPLQLPGKVIAIEVSENNAWIADNTTVARKTDLESGKTLQIYAGHRGPVSALALWSTASGNETRQILITGSWDKTIKLWDTKTKQIISSTEAHSDFVKSLLVYPSLNLLVSGSSDKIVRFWDLTNALDGQPLQSVGSISSHTRPVECLDGQATGENSAELCTGDTMGIINLWTLTKEDTTPPRWKSTLKNQYKHHRTKITEMIYGNGQLVTASLDETVQTLDISSTDANTKNPPTPTSIQHPTGVRCILSLSLTTLAEPYLITGSGDVLRIYDVSSPKEPELISETDAHWHDVTAIRLWIRKNVAEDGTTRLEPWVVSTSLDETVRRWKLSELLTPKPKSVEHQKVSKPPALEVAEQGSSGLTAEEEAELAELMDD